MPFDLTRDRRGYVILFEMVGLKMLATESPTLTAEEIDVVRAFLERVKQRAAAEEKKAAG